jgi:TPR repeat protein
LSGTAAGDRKEAGDRRLLRAAVLWRAGRSSEAEDLYRSAAEANSVRAMNNLGVLLSYRGGFDEALRWHQRAVDTGDARALTCIGMIHSRQGNVAEAEGFYRRAISAGDRAALRILSNLIDHRRELDRMVDLYRWAVACGHDDAIPSLAGYVSLQGDREEAEALYRRAVGAGDVSALLGLAGLLRKDGRAAETNTDYRTAVEGGQKSSLVLLGAGLLLEPGSEREARALLRRASRAGDARADALLVADLVGFGRSLRAMPRARRAYRRGDVHVRCYLDDLRESNGLYQPTPAYPVDIGRLIRDLRRRSS